MIPFPIVLIFTNKLMVGFVKELVLKDLLNQLIILNVFLIILISEMMIIMEILLNIVSKCKNGDLDVKNVKKDMYQESVKTLTGLYNVSLLKLFLTVNGSMKSILDNGCVKEDAKKDTILLLIILLVNL